MVWDICGLVKRMKNSKSIFNNCYINFSILYIIISSISFFLIKQQTNAILKTYPNSFDAVKNINNISLCFGLLSLIIGVLFVYIIRLNIVKFSDSIIDNIDSFISQDKEIILETNKDTLLSKIQNKFKYMIEIMENKNRRYLEEKDNIKSLISDISHQIKTPIANISMYNETLINRELDRDKQIIFLENMQNQVNKLEWLVKSLIKMSRLESGMIALEIEKHRISDTIANALSGIYLKSEEKNISINVDIDEKLELYHDKKWTSEAIFNIVENSVKYTKDNGSINLKIDKMELFTKISIIDNGIGIDEYEINNVFKRFYRSSDVSNTEGVGVGLYLAREIINKQSGYIKVESKKGVGTSFYVYMKN